MTARKHCPDCRALLLDSDRCDECGWGAGRPRVGKAQDPNHGRCVYITGSGQRCTKAGTLSPATMGENTPWYCSEHFWQRQKSDAGRINKSVGLRSIQDLHAVLMQGKKNV